MENIEQLLSRLEARYGNPEADFMARAGTMQDFGQAGDPIPVAKEPEPRIQTDLEIHTKADWDEATAKLKDVQSLSAYISQSSYKDREKLLKVLQQYMSTIDKKMAFPEEEEDQCAEIWLGKARDILNKRFNLLRITVHRMKQPKFQQGLQREIQKYFEGIGMHEHPSQEGDTIVGQEEWFEIWPSPNDDATRNMKIKEIEMQPYYTMYRDNEEEDEEEAIKRFIFPGLAWVYEEKKEA